VSALLVITAVELYPTAPALTEPIPRFGPPPVYAWLSELESEATLVELPSPAPSAAPNRIYALRQVYAATHWHRVVDGVSSWVPPLTDTIRERLVTFPDDPAMAQIHALRLDYVIVHLDEYPEAERARILAGIENRHELTLEQRFGDCLAYHVE
jgi:hypothetical protein